jgi:hypothetical protein
MLVDHGTRTPSRACDPPPPLPQHTPLHPRAGLAPLLAPPSSPGGRSSQRQRHPVALQSAISANQALLSPRFAPRRKRAWSRSGESGVQTRIRSSESGVQTRFRFRNLVKIDGVLVFFPYFVSVFHRRFHGKEGTDRETGWVMVLPSWTISLEAF